MVMEQTFQLKEYGNLSLFEQNNLTAEDRGWWIERLNKEYKERNERERSATNNGASHPHLNIPNIRRP